MTNSAMPLVQSADMLTAWTGGLTTPKVILFTNNIVPDNSTAYADLTQPTASWYTAATATFGTTYDNPDGSVSATCTSVQFDYSGSDPSETIYGYGVADVSGTTLYCAANLPQPVTMAGALDAVIVQPQVTIPAIQQS